MSDISPQWQLFQALAKGRNKSDWARANVKAAFQQAQYSDELARQGISLEDRLDEWLKTMES